MPSGPRCKLGSRISLPPTCGSRNDLPLGAFNSVQFKPFVLVARNKPACPFGSRKKEKRKTLLVSAAKPAIRDSASMATVNKAAEGHRTCIFLIVLLGRLESESQAGVLRPVATGRRMAFAGTCALCLRAGVMRLGACSASARCSKLEPLLEHDNLKTIVARILQV